MMCRNPDGSPGNTYLAPRLEFNKRCRQLLTCVQVNMDDPGDIWLALSPKKGEFSGKLMESHAQQICNEPLAGLRLQNNEERVAEPSRSQQKDEPFGHYLMAESDDREAWLREMRVAAPNKALTNSAGDGGDATSFEVLSEKYQLATEKKAKVENLRQIEATEADEEDDEEWQLVLPHKESLEEVQQALDPIRELLKSVVARVTAT